MISQRTPTESMVLALYMKAVKAWIHTSLQPPAIQSGGCAINPCCCSPRCNMCTESIGCGRPVGKHVLLLHMQVAADLGGPLENIVES